MRFETDDDFDDGGTPEWRRRKKTISISTRKNLFMRWIHTLTIWKIVLIFFIAPIIGVPIFYIGSILTAYMTGWNVWICMAWVAFWMLFVIFYAPLRRNKLRVEAKWAAKKRSANAK